ncbi:MAG TPA: monovalent cation/H(+) antiporter subunit G [Mycobacteriales bacterium]|nr:monovalent cation/H(+) antiporter subunit G [Mycobacteriales bacterium]HWA65365.1 monovalent cation/H(+) antiporter subunit G [Mycobacteriales bacterium]
MIVAVAVLVAIGAFSSLSGAIGILRLPDVYCRVQASTKNVTLGALPVLIAVVLARGWDTPYSPRVLIVAGLMLVASPAASHALIRAAWKIGVPQWRGAVGPRVNPAVDEAER